MMRTVDRLSEFIVVKLFESDVKKSVTVTDWKFNSIYLWFCSFVYISMFVLF